MRAPAGNRRPNRGRKAHTYSVPAPTRGWNARDALASMRPGDAVKLINWFPNTSDVSLRLGSSNFSTGLGTTQVETLVSYKPPSGVNSLWAFAGTSIYNSTSSGALPAASVTGLTNARFQTTNFSTTAGNFLLAVNGADKLQMYNGTTWAALDSASTPPITGVATTALINLNVFKNRVFYIEKNSFRIWYSAVGAFAGALTILDLSSLFKNGGNIVAMGSWTLDGGQGPDDLAVFISSTGEVAIYQGVDPSSVDSWSLVGVYQIGRPIGMRCLQKYKGDLIFITTSGIVPASQALIDEQSTSTKALTDRISGALGTAAAAFSANFGWEAKQYPDGGMLVLNVPTAVGQQQQYVMNTTTGAWCQFTGWNANCFEIHNNNLYYGTAGGVVQAWTTNADNGAAITGEMVGAYDYFRNRDGLKEVTMFRPIIGWNINPTSFFAGVNVDFVDVTPVGAISFPITQAGTWDSAIWDQAIWGGDVILNTSWYSANGIGFAIAPHIIVSSNAANIKVAAFDFAYKSGGVI